MKDNLRNEKHTNELKRSYSKEKKEVKRIRDNKGMLGRRKWREAYCDRYCKKTDE